MGTGEKKKTGSGLRDLKFWADKTTPRPTFSNVSWSESQTESYGYNVGAAMGDETETTYDEGQTSLVATSRANTHSEVKVKRWKRTKKLDQQKEAYPILSLTSRKLKSL